MKFKIGKKTKPKLLINIGAMMDVPTGALITGARGETIINGGLGAITGVVGAGNNYKSTMLHYMMLSAANRMAASGDTAMHTYDTEVNISLEGLERLGSRHKYLGDDLIFAEDPIWSTTDKSQYSADEWFTILKEQMVEKEKNKKNIRTFTAFKDPYTGGPLQDFAPSFVEIDSFSEFEAGTTMDLMDKSKQDDSSTNMLFMKQGLYKTKVLTELPRITSTSATYMLLTAQIGDEFDMRTGPAAYTQPTKKLQYLKSGDKVKGVSSKFFFLLSNGWFANNASVLKNQGTKLPEYPRTPTDTNPTELNIVKLTQLRSKSGPSGYIIDVIISQTEGVLAELTEFHHIKSQNRYGISGTNTSYSLDLRPDVKVGRTTIRRKIDSDPLLCRAINITSEMLQLETFHTHLREDDLMCTPIELFNDLKEMGYDWDILLNTRGWWTIDQYNTETPFLSTVDLLKMRKGLYFPYFLNEDKTLKQGKK